jgi:outer membrane protein assembly factor BamA
LGARITDDLGNLVHPGGDPLGGDLVMNLNVELRFPLLYGLSGAAFVDGGGAYLQDRPIRLLDDFRRSAGPGLRYNTPVGPISLDYGFKLDRRSGESIGEIHFSIGTIF